MKNVSPEPSEKQTALTAVSSLPRLKASPLSRSWGHCVLTFLTAQVSTAHPMTTISSTHPSISEVSDRWSFLIHSGIYAYSHLSSFDPTPLLDSLNYICLIYKQICRDPALKAAHLCHCLVKIPEVWDTWEKVWTDRETNHQLQDPGEKAGFTTWQICGKTPTPCHCRMTQLSSAAAAEELIRQRPSREESRPDGLFQVS